MFFFETEERSVEYNFFWKMTAEPQQVSGTDSLVIHKGSLAFSSCWMQVFTILLSLDINDDEKKTNEFEGK